MKVKTQPHTGVTSFETRTVFKRIGVSLLCALVALALAGCRSTADKAANEQLKSSERQARIVEKENRAAEKERRSLVENERRTAEAQRHWQEVLAPLSNEQLRFKLAGLEQAIARGTDGMNILLQQGNGIGALIAQGQTEAKVKERDAVGMELARRATSARSEPPSAPPGGDGPTHIKRSGSGFFITEDGHFVTCAHVVQGATRIVIRNKAAEFGAIILRLDDVNDIAVLKVNGSFHALPLVSSGSIRLGETVSTIGFPDPQRQGIEPKFTRGDISSVTGINDNPREFQISVPVQPGNSGGPLINKYGAVIGVVASKLNSTLKPGQASAHLPENVNYAVKSSHVLLVLESLPGVSNRLREPSTTQERKQEDVAAEVSDAIGLVVVF